MSVAQLIADMQPLVGRTVEVWTARGGYVGTLQAVTGVGATVVPADAAGWTSVTVPLDMIERFNPVPAAPDAADTPFVVDPVPPWAGG